MKSKMKIKMKIAGKLWGLSAILLFVSCAKGFDDNETFSGGVTNAQLESPVIDDNSFSTLTNSDGTESVKITWPVVMGAGGYLLNVDLIEDPADPTVTTENPVVVMQDSVLRKMGTGANEDDFSGDQKFELLTEREVEIVQAIAEGFTNKEIAEKLYLSEGTIKNCVSSILNKLQLKHRTQIAIYYLKR